MMIEHIDKLIEAGIDSFKIEGRMKSPYYVASVVSSYRRAMDDYYSSEGDYVFGVTTEEGTAASANMLRGSDEEELTTGGDIYFKLSLNANSDPESVGFYYGAEGGAAFTNGAHKAYLALPAEQAAGANYVWYDVTGISGVKLTCLRAFTSLEERRLL